MRRRPGKRLLRACFQRSCRKSATNRGGPPGQVGESRLAASAAEPGAGLRAWACLKREQLTRADLLPRDSAARVGKGASLWRDRARRGRPIEISTARRAAHSDGPLRSWEPRPRSGEPGRSGVARAVTRPHAEARPQSTLRLVRARVVSTGHEGRFRLPNSTQCLRRNIQAIYPSRVCQRSHDDEFVGHEGAWFSNVSALCKTERQPEGCSQSRRPR
jgi:hypothetical protein